MNSECAYIHTFFATLCKRQKKEFYIKASNETIVLASRNFTIHRICASFHLGSDQTIIPLAFAVDYMSKN